MIPGTMMPTFTTQAKVIAWIALLVLIAIITMSCQSSCGRKHETNAAVYDAVADTHAAEVKELKQQLAGKDKVIEDRTATALAFKKKYEDAKAKIPVVPIPAPVTETGLTESLKELGFRNDVVVRIAEPSVLNTIDAALVFTLGQEAKRAKVLEEALVACSQTVAATEAVVKVQTEKLDLSDKALQQSQAESSARKLQAQELGKALMVEKSKWWEKPAIVVITAAIVSAVKK